LLLDLLPIAVCVAIMVTFRRSHLLPSTPQGWLELAIDVFLFAGLLVRRTRVLVAVRDETGPGAFGAARRGRRGAVGHRAVRDDPVGHHLLLRARCRRAAPPDHARGSAARRQRPRSRVCCG